MPISRIQGLAASEARTSLSVSIVVPTLNEEHNLPHVLGQLPSFVDQLVIVDGHSSDRTVEVARSLAPDARIIEQGRHGKGDAIRCGLAACKGDIIVMLDADGSMRPSELPRFVDALRSGAQFVKGTRFSAAGGSEDLTVTRRMGNRVLCTLVNSLFDARLTDLCYGYIAFWRYCLPSLAFDYDGFEVETVLNIRAVQRRLRICEVPSFEQRRHHGTSNLRIVRDGSRVLRTIMRERFKPSLSAVTPPRPAEDLTRI